MFLHVSILINLANLMNLSDDMNLVDKIALDMWNKTIMLLPPPNVIVCYTFWLIFAQGNPDIPTGIDFCLF